MLRVFFEQPYTLFHYSIDVANTESGLTFEIASPTLLYASTEAQLLTGHGRVHVFSDSILHLKYVVNSCIQRVTKDQDSISIDELTSLMYQNIPSKSGLTFFSIVIVGTKSVFKWHPKDQEPHSDAKYKRHLFCRLSFEQPDAEFPVEEPNQDFIDERSTLDLNRMKWIIFAAALILSISVAILLFRRLRRNNVPLGAFY